MWRLISPEKPVPPKHRPQATHTHTHPYWSCSTNTSNSTTQKQKWTNTMQQEFLHQPVYTCTKSQRDFITQVCTTLTEVKCFKYSASCSEMLFAESAVKEMFCSFKTFFSCVSSTRFPQTSLPPSHSPFSVFPSFLIHFLCITPLLSTPIYSALPPPIFHKHTLYFSLLPSATLLLSFPSSLSSSALRHFPLLLPFIPFIISLSLLQSRHPILSISTPLYLYFPSSLSFSVHHAVCLHCCHPPF